MRVLISWLGLNDLKAVSGPEKADDPGPVLRLLRGERFDRVHLLHDFVGHESSRSNAVKAEEVALFLAAKVGMDESTVALHLRRVGCTTITMRCMNSPHGKSRQFAGTTIPPSNSLHSSAPAMRPRRWQC